MEAISIAGLIFGIGLGYVVAKALKVAVIIGLIIMLLTLLGVTAISKSQVESFLRVVMPAIEWVKTLIESSQLFAIGLLIGFIIGFIK